jgi:hypothetical protein
MLYLYTILFPDQLSHNPSSMGAFIGEVIEIAWSKGPMRGRVSTRLFYGRAGTLIAVQNTLNFYCNPILFAVCTSTFSKLCINVYSGM